MSGLGSLKSTKLIFSSGCSILQQQRYVAALVAAGSNRHVRVQPSKFKVQVRMRMQASLHSSGEGLKARNDMNVESWCQVEGNCNQQWTRATRRHDPNAFTSTAFDQEEGEVSKGRVDWSMANKPAQQKLAKRKHFPQKCKSTAPLLE